MPLPVLRTLTSETNCRASASVRNPMRCNSSRGITVTYAGVVVTGWGRFPAMVTSWSSNVGGCSGGFLASCALASGGRGFANTPTRITENKNAQWPRLPLGECSTIPPTSSTAKACGEWCGQVFWLPGHRSLRPSQTGTPRRRYTRSVAHIGENLPVTAARPRRSYTGLPLNPHLYRRYSSDQWSHSSSSHQVQKVNPGTPDAEGGGGLAPTSRLLFTTPQG